MRIIIMIGVLVLVLVLTYNVHTAYATDEPPYVLSAELEAHIRSVNAKMNWIDATNWVKANNPTAYATIEAVMMSFLEIQQQQDERLAQSRAVVEKLSQQLASKR